MRHKMRDINVEVAFLHMLADTLVSVGVLVSGFVISYTGWYVIDPIISLVIVVVILFSTWHLLSQSLRLSLDGIPENIDISKVKNDITSLSHVEDVHHVHVWAISTEESALTAHVVVDCNENMEEVKHRIREKLAEDGITHATLELEHHGEHCCCPGD